jgi:hypothetical protein
MISGMVVPKANTAPNETACFTRPQKMQVTPAQNGRGGILIQRPVVDFTRKFPFLLSNVKWCSFDF